jgi:hypothetical protein
MAVHSASFRLEAPGDGPGLDFDTRPPRPSIQVQVIGE